MKILLLNFRAVLMSFGTVAIDNMLRTAEWPHRSMLTGLLANALGWDRSQTAALNHLQARVRFAVRQDAKPTRLVDFQQAHLLGQDYFSDIEIGRDFIEHSKCSKKLVLRRKEFLTNGAYTVALRLTREAEEPTLDQLADALERPARTLFLGRRCCIPSAKILIGVVEAENLAAALHSENPARLAWMRGEQGFPAPTMETRSFGDRDWHNNVHTGHTILCEGTYVL